jgi:hypothetical protein
MRFPDAWKSARALTAAALLFLAVAPVIESGSASTAQHIVAEGTYVYGDSSSKTRENWTLSKTAAGNYVAEGNAAQENVQGELLNYRVDMDAKLHPSLIDLHSSVDLPSYTCKLTDTDVQCILSYEAEGGPQNARMKAPFDLLGFHSYGWILSSVVGRLEPGQSQVTVHLFLPSEDRYPNAVAEVRRETPDSITIAGKTFEAQRFRVKLIMDSSDISTCSVWTSRSRLVLRMQAPGESSSGGDLPAVELISYKQTEPFIPELQQ